MKQKNRFLFFYMNEGHCLVVHEAGSERISQISWDKE